MSISIVSTAVAADELTMSRITDLTVWNGTIYGTTRLDGRIASWDANTLSITSTAAHQSDPIAGGNPALMIVDGDLLGGGGTNYALRSFDLSSGGQLGNETDFGIDGSFTDFAIWESGGLTHVYGAKIGSNVGHLTFSGGSLLTENTVSTANSISGLITADLSGTAYLFTTSGSEGTVTSWGLSASGTPTISSVLTPTQGFWASVPTDIVTAKIDGETYLIVAGSGSSSLSTLHLSAGGGLQTVDHILDDRDTRFANVTALDVIEHLGQTFVIAAGSDDGITILQLLPGGRLLPRATIADTEEATLSNPSAIAAQADSTGFDIFVASSTEAGLTKLRYETGSNLLVLAGTAAAEPLNGGSGDDVIIDGAGSDQISGNSGADVFVMSADDASDTITDFTIGSDLVDLSGWIGLRDASQLFITETNTGLQVTYGAEVLVVNSNDGQTIDTSEFMASGLLLPTRLPQVPLPGLSGPAQIEPTLPDRDVYVAPTQTLESFDEGIERLGVAADDILTGTDFADLLWGQGGNDTINGNDGNDMLFGGSGGDDINGGAGNDHLSGGAGRDMRWTDEADTQNNADRLFGEAGNDVLLGNAGADHLDGGAGDDVMTGGSGRDAFVFRDGNDRITDYMPQVDRLILEDDLWAGTLNASEVVSTYASVDGPNIVFDFGDNTLTLEGLSTLDGLADRIDFV